jgi:hypothetical protein
MRYSHAVVFMRRTDEFDPGRWGVDDESSQPTNVTAKRRPRTYKRFLKGPIPEAWLIRAMVLPGKALAVGLLLWLEHGITGRWTVRFCQDRYAARGISWRTAHRGIKELEQAGLIEVSSRPGSGLDVTILDLEDSA